MNCSKNKLLHVTRQKKKVLDQSTGVEVFSKLARVDMRIWETKLKFQLFAVTKIII